MTAEEGVEKPDFAGVTEGKESWTMCGLGIDEEEFSRMNERAYSAIFLEGNNIAASDDLPYRSRHSFANYSLTRGLEQR